MASDETHIECGLCGHALTIHRESDSLVDVSNVTLTCQTCGIWAKRQISNEIFRSFSGLRSQKEILIKYALEPMADELYQAGLEKLQEEVEEEPKAEEPKVFAYHLPSEELSKRRWVPPGRGLLYGYNTGRADKPTSRKYG